MVFPSPYFPPPSVTPPSVQQAQEHQRVGTDGWNPFGPTAATDVDEGAVQPGCDQ